MSIRTNISDYAHGEAFSPQATLTSDGVELTTGSVEMRLALTAGGDAALTVAGSHAGGGVWSFTVSAAQMAFAPEGRTVYYELWDTAADRRYAWGAISVAASITS